MTVDGERPVTRIHEEYDGEQCPYCFQFYAFPVDKHHTRQECIFREMRNEEYDKHKPR